MAKYCSNCGHELKDDESACPECGTPVQDKPAAEDGHPSGDHDANPDDQLHDDKAPYIQVSQEHKPERNPRTIYIVVIILVICALVLFGIFVYALTTGTEEEEAETEQVEETPEEPENEPEEEVVLPENDNEEQEAEEADTEEEAVTDDQKTAYALYYDKCEEYIREYGEGAFVDNSEVLAEDDITIETSYIEGLAFADLVDFNGDGMDELVVAYRTDELHDGTLTQDTSFDYSDETSYYLVEVWEYADGEIHLAYQDIPLWTNEADIQLAAFVEGENEIYMATGYSADIGIIYLYALEDGQFDLSYTIQVADGVNYLDGEELTDEEAEEMFTGEQSYYLQGQTDSELFEPTLDTLNETLDFLASQS